MTTKIKYVGEDVYRGIDYADGDTPIHLNAGDSTKVSDEKGAQLAADMPHLFEIDGKPAAPAPKPAAGGSEADPDSPAELLKLTRGALEEKAEALGVVEPEKLPNKQAVADAITAALAEQE